VHILHTNVYNDLLSGTTDTQMVVIQGLLQSTKRWNKHFSPTRFFPDISFTFCWHLVNSLTFPGLPDKRSSCTSLPVQRRRAWPLAEPRCQWTSASVGRRSDDVSYSLALIGIRTRTPRHRRCAPPTVAEHPTNTTVYLTSCTPPPRSTAQM